MWDFPANPIVGQSFTPPGATTTYQWNGYAWTSGGRITSGAADFVDVTGDTMTGFLTLNADPTAPLHASTKQYVDARSVPLGGNAGEALVKNAANVPTWGYPIDDGNY